MINPDTVTARLYQGRRARKDAKMVALMQYDECVWRTSSKGGKQLTAKTYTCCTCLDDEGVAGCVAQFKQLAGNTRDLAMVVRDCRAYYHRLSPTGKREWWAQHMHYSGYDRAAASARPLIKGQRLNTYFLEHPAQLTLKLASAQAEVGGIPNAPNAELYGVCMRFLRFFCGGHVDTVYDQAIRRAAYSSPTDPRPSDFDVNIPAQRSMYSGIYRVSAKTNLIREYLECQRRLSMILPNSNKVVLPFRTNMCTHLYLVMEMENDADVEWARDIDQFAETVALDEKGARFLESGKDMPGDMRRKDDSKNPSNDEDESDDHPAVEDQNENPFADEDESDDSPAVVDKSKNPFADENDRPAVEDVSVDPPAVEDADPDDVQATLALLAKEMSTPVTYRYGNRLCERTGTKPELPEIPSLMWFNQVWTNDATLREIVCRQHLPFAKCDFCVRQRDLFSQKRNADQRRGDKRELRAHLNSIVKEKLMYYSNRTRARAEPRRYLSIIFDGADQSKYDTPHFAERSHISELRKIKMHMYGALVHGRKAYAFTCPDHEHQGHNTTIQALWHVINDQLDENGELPPVLLLQLDNTTKQNKGRYHPLYCLCCTLTVTYYLTLSTIQSTLINTLLFQH
jgi:hypothetical protein